MKHISVIIALIILSMQSFAQSNSSSTDLARPSIGWDAFKNTIVYPEIARRAGVEGISNVAVKLDTTGRVIDIMISGYNIFDASIEQAVKKATWIPQRENGAPRATSVFFDVQFQYRDTKGSYKRTLVIEADKPNGKAEK